MIRDKMVIIYLKDLFYLKGFPRDKIW